MRTQQLVAIALLGGVLGSARPDATHGTAASALTGTSWQLQQITLVGDSARPDNSAKYTITFRPGKRALIRADCNRGVMSWTTAEDDEIVLGPVKMTQVKCASGSMYKRFVNDLAYVRWYSLDGERLSLHLRRSAGSLDFTPLAE